MKAKFSKIVFVLALAMQVIMLGARSVQAQDKIQVVASFYPMYEFAKQVGGDRIDLTLMVDGASSPHGYEPSAQDIVTINDADVFVYSSDAMEYWAESLLVNMSNEELIVVKASGEADSHAGHDHEHEEEATEEEAHDHDHEDEASEEEAHDHDHEEEHAEETEHDHEEEAHDHDHENEAQSGPVTITGLSEHYHSGDVLSLQAEASEDLGVSQWQWQVRQGEQDWETILASGDILEYELTEEVELQALGLNEAGEVVVESDILHAHIDNHDDLDPHSWLDPVLAQEQVDHIKDAFIQADPEGEAVYTENAEAFKAELQQLDADYQAAFQDAENCQFIVQHEAFGYIANRYHLEQLSIGGLSTEVEPSPQRMGEISNLIEETGASIIYYQSGANTAIAQTIADETGSEIVELFDLELAPEGQDISYIEAMYQNLEALKLSIN